MTFPWRQNLIEKQFFLTKAMTHPVMERRRRTSKKVKRFRLLGRIERRKLNRATQDAVEVISDVRW